jgi:hypothetical protein
MNVVDVCVKGSIKIHSKCFQKFFRYQKSLKCGICKFKYCIQKLSKLPLIQNTIQKIYQTHYKKKFYKVLNELVSEKIKIIIDHLNFDVNDKYPFIKIEKYVYDDDPYDELERKYYNLKNYGHDDFETYTAFYFINGEEIWRFIDIRKNDDGTFYIVNYGIY